MDYELTDDDLAGVEGGACCCCYPCPDRPGAICCGVMDEEECAARGGKCSAPGRCQP